MQPLLRRGPTVKRCGPLHAHMQVTGNFHAEKKPGSVLISLPYITAGLSLETPGEIEGLAIIPRRFQFVTRRVASGLSPAQSSKVALVRPSHVDDQREFPLA